MTLEHLAQGVTVTQEDYVGPPTNTPTISAEHAVLDGLRREETVGNKCYTGNRFASEAKGQQFESARAHHSNHSTLSNCTKYRRFRDCALVGTVPDFVPTLCHSRAFQRFTRSVQIRMNVALGCCKVAMTR